MLKIVISLLVGLLVGAAGGFAAGIIAFPFLFPPPPVNEMVTDKTPEDVVAQGHFIHANPDDPLHFGTGGVTLYADLVHLGEDFRVGPGPKYHVYLVPEPDVTPKTRVRDTMFVDLGRLKAFSGSQNYPIPSGVNLAAYSSVVIWCEQFSVLISPAHLDFVH
ncbi:MAG: DM13 domain-containing protein [Gammaproteobacteria bacterium]|nr:DM13 domain-containing protein [Gammaproteobacteria bacterium]